MNSLKSFLISQLFFISMMVTMALRHTIETAYFGQHSDASILWAGSILMTAVFFFALPQVWKASKSQDTATQATYTKRAKFPLWICGIGFILFEFISLKELLGTLTALQVPLQMKALSVGVTLINFISGCAWTADNFRQWKAAPKKTAGAQEQANG